MSNYTKSTNFATKDNLSPGDPLKIVRGTEIDTEFNNISTAVSTKTDNSAAAITGGSITGITDLAIADGGTGASTATAALNNLLPTQTSNANKYLQTDGTNATWDAISINTGDITGTLPVANGGTGVTSSTGTGNVVLSNSPTLITPALGTPASGVATNVTGLPISTGVSGLGTGVATFLGTPSSANLASAVSDETGSGALVFANSPTLVTPALGTPSALVGTNITGTASGLTVGNVTTNANLTGAVTSVGNATSLGSFTSAQLATALTDETGSGSNVFATSPTLVTPVLGTPTSVTLTNATGLPLSTGVTGTLPVLNGGTGVTTSTGSGNNVLSTSPTLVTPVLGTPTSATLTNATGLPLTTGVTGTLPTANGGTNLTSFTSGGVVYASSTSALATGSGLTFDGTNLGVGETTASGRLTVKRTNDGTLAYFDGTTTQFRVDVSASTIYLNAQNGVAQMAFQTNASEGMRLTSTSLYTASGINVGIGTSSPAEKLQVVGKILSTGDGRIGVKKDGSDTVGSGPFFGMEKADATRAWFMQLGASNTFDWWYYSGGATYTKYMTLDSAGNLGLGVTPSAWGSFYKAIESTSASEFAITSRVNGIEFGRGYYKINAGFASIYTSSQAASKYEQTLVGEHRWSTAPPGTEGNPISFTQAMTLEASGNLLVGTTSGSGRLYASLPSNTVPTIVANNQFAGSSGLNTFYSSLGNGVNSVANTNCYHLQAVSQGSAIYYLYGNGTTSFTSDQRLKKNIETTRNGYAQDLCKLRVVKYQWNTEPDDGPKELGLIAQEVEQVFPGLIQDAADEIQGIKPKVLKASVLPFMLLKAMQEQQALITSLTARITALESKEIS